MMVYRSGSTRFLGNIRIQIDPWDFMGVHFSSIFCVFVIFELWTPNFSRVPPTRGALAKRKPFYPKVLIICVWCYAVQKG